MVTGMVIYGAIQCQVNMTGQDYWRYSTWINPSDIDRIEVSLGYSLSQAPAPHPAVSQVPVRRRQQLIPDSRPVAIECSQANARQGALAMNSQNACIALIGSADSNGRWQWRVPANQRENQT